MPQRNIDALGEEDRRAVADYVPGYDWIPGRFGPPPGIAKARKDEFDQMSDREYLYAFLKLTQEEKESLMVSEAERRRTYIAHWPIETIVKANDCAKEGFYYTGVADRVQCAFCGGIIRNWERGDVPNIQHKNFFNYCKIVQNKPSQNMPIGLSNDIVTDQLSSLVDSRPTLGDLNVNTVKPTHPTLSVYATRKETYRRYSIRNPIDADRLCEAGLFYEGVSDKVKCFWCDGALEMWSRGDDPWVEHAKWYPGCTYVQQSKGIEFVKKARAQITADQLFVAEGLAYNKGDLSFLVEDVPVVEKKSSLSEMQGFLYCVELDYKRDHIRQAYKANNDEEFEDQSVLVEIVQDLSEGDRRSLEKWEKQVKSQTILELQEENPVERMDVTPNPRRVNITELLLNTDDPSAQDSDDIITGTRCKNCFKRMSGAVVLPCGCFCICQVCSRGSLPKYCPTCGKKVRGACRTFTS